MFYINTSLMYVYWGKLRHFLHLYERPSDYLTFIAFTWYWEHSKH